MTIGNNAAITTKIKPVIKLKGSTGTQRVPLVFKVGEDVEPGRWQPTLTVRAVTPGVAVSPESVTIRADTGPDGVAIMLCDDGPGLPMRAREHLFKPFAGTARPGGTGLGLAIAREIMVAHRGDLRLDLLGHTQTVSMTRQGLQSVVARQTLLYSVARPGPVVNILQEFVVPIKYAYELLVAGE